MGFRMRSRPWKRNKDIIIIITYNCSVIGSNPTKSSVLNSAFLLQIHAWPDQPGDDVENIVLPPQKQHGHSFSWHDSTYQTHCHRSTFPTIRANKNAFSEQTSRKRQMTLWKLLPSRLIVSKQFQTAVIHNIFSFFLSFFLFLFLFCFFVCCCCLCCDADLP